MCPQKMPHFVHMQKPFKNVLAESVPCSSNEELRWALPQLVYLGEIVNPEFSVSGSDHMISAKGPSCGTSWIRSNSAISLIVSIEGDKPMMLN